MKRDMSVHYSGRMCLLCHMLWNLCHGFKILRSFFRLQGHNILHSCEPVQNASKSLVETFFIEALFNYSNHLSFIHQSFGTNGPCPHPRSEKKRKEHCATISMLNLQYTMHNDKHDTCAPPYAFLVGSHQEPISAVLLTSTESSSQS